MLNQLINDIQIKIYKYISDVTEHNKLRLTNKNIYYIYKNTDMNNIYKYNVYKEKFINVILILDNKYKIEPL